MKKLIPIIALVGLLAACGGGDPATDPAPQAAAACRYALVVHGATLAPAGACTVISHATTVAQLGADVDQARAAAGAPRAYIVATGPGADLTLGLGAAGTGHIDGASLWLGTFDPATDLKGSIVTWRLNGNCAALAAGLQARWTPAYCAPATAFDPIAAIAQLGV